MVELHPEIWRNIFKLVKRDPLPAHVPYPWGDLHQHDLATLMRVSPTFNNLVGPLLYSSVTALHLTDLLKGFSDDAPPAHPSIQSKKALLRHVKHVRVAYQGPTGHNAFTMGKLLDKEIWRELGEPSAEQSVRQGAEGLMDMQHIVDVLGHLPDKAIFMPNLETVVLGQPDSFAWQLIDASGTFDEKLRESLYMLQLALSSMILRCKPRSICQYGTRGPYCLTSVVPIVNPGLVVTSHMDEPRCPALLISGAVNRLVYAPGTAFGPPTLMTPMSMPDFSGPAIMTDIGKALHALYTMEHGDWPEGVQQIKPDAKVEIYGMCHPPGNEASAILPNDYTTEDLDDHSSEEEDDGGVDFGDDVAREAYGFRELQREGERLYLDRCRACPAPHSTLEKYWKDAVTFHKWQDTPVCGACQWDINDPASWDAWMDYEAEIWAEGEDTLMRAEPSVEHIGMDPGELWYDHDGNTYTEEELWDYEHGLNDL